MKKRILFIMCLPAICAALVSCKDRTSDSTILITRVPVNMQATGIKANNSWRQEEGAQIISLDAEKQGSEKVLTGDFYSACYPEVSYDGRYMLFSGQKGKGDRWQIYEMEIKKGEIRKVFQSDADCTDPVYLPAGRLAFTRHTVNDTVKSADCLYTGNLNGTGIMQITFGPYKSFATTVLKDGRLLTLTRMLLPETTDPMLMVLRPDGTKADMFYKDASGNKLYSRARETDDGRIFFIEDNKNNAAEGDVVSITYNRPLHSKVNYTSEISGDFNTVLPLKSGKFILSYRKPDSDHYALYESDIPGNIPGTVIYDNDEFNVLDAVVAAEYNRPKKLPSEVDMHVKTGLLMCQDINFTGFISSSGNGNTPIASRIEVMGTDSAYGVVPVEADGSFYLKVLADKPFQIRTLDEKGNVINGNCAWLWLRPNERRGCVGCHEDPEMVPQNRIPLAVKKNPVIIPVHVTKIKEKIVELE